MNEQVLKKLSELSSSQLAYLARLVDEDTSGNQDDPLYVLLRVAYDACDESPGSTAQDVSGIVHCLCHELHLRTVAGHTTQFYVYRLASAGPNSEPVTRCVKCGRVLDIDTTREAK